MAHTRGRCEREPGLDLESGGTDERDPNLTPAGRRSSMARPRPPHATPPGAHKVRKTPILRGRTAGILLLTGLLTFTPAVASAAAGTDRTPPTVTATTPTNGTVGAAVTVKPTATFSEPIQPASVAVTLTSGKTAVPFTTTYASATNTVTIAPSAALSWWTKYTLSIKAKDLAGNQMPAAARTWSFTTVAATDNPPAAKLIASPTSGTSPLSVHLD